jgi:membrane associated rhomboid family serine protease
VLPIGDDNPTNRTSFVVYVLIGLNVFIFGHQLGLSQPELREFFATWAIVPAQLTASFRGEPSVPAMVPEWVTLVSSQFLHGGFLHLGGNMLFLWIFGNNIEDRLGHTRFAIFYILCGILAGLSQWLISQDSAVPLLGASGAIAGVMGAYIIRFPGAKVLTLVFLGFFITTIYLPAVVYLGFWFLQQAFLGLAGLNLGGGEQTGGVAYWAHAGGFVFGILLAPLLGLFRDER